MIFMLISVLLLIVGAREYDYELLYSSVGFAIASSIMFIAHSIRTKLKENEKRR